MAKNNEFRLDSPGETAVHLCVDMQRMFAEDTEWSMPWFERVLPKIAAIASAHPERTIFTRFIPASQPKQGVGMWKRYYERWSSMTIDHLGPELIGLVPDLARFVPPARIFDKHVYSPWTGTDLHQQLRTGGIDTIIITGGETDVCAGDHAGRDRLGFPRHPRHRCALQFGRRNPRRHDECVHEPLRRTGRNRHNQNADRELADARETSLVIQKAIVPLIHTNGPLAWVSKPHRTGDMLISIGKNLPQRKST